MQTLASNVCCVVDEMKQIHTDYLSPVEKKGWYSHSLKGRVLWPLSGVESASILALTGFYCFLIAYIKEGSHSLCSGLL